MRPRRLDADLLSRVAAPAGPGISFVDDLPRLIDDFDRYLLVGGRALSTRLKYGVMLRRFESWLELEVIDPSRVSPQDIERFLEGLAIGPRTRTLQLSPTTVGNWVKVLRSFFTYLDRFGRLIDNDGNRFPNPAMAIVLPPERPRANDFLTPDEDRALLSYPAKLHERTIVWLLRWTGMRVSEATSLCVRDLDLTPGRETLTVRKSKTPRGRRQIPIPPLLVPITTEWQEHLNGLGLGGPDDVFLATRHGTPMKATFVWRVVKRVAFRAGVRPVPCRCGSRRKSLHDRSCPRTRTGENLSRISPHTLRRTYGSDLLSRGVRLEVVSHLLGHSSTTVTEQAYAELLLETTRREVLTALGFRTDLGDPSEGDAAGSQALPLYPGGTGGSSL